MMCQETSDACASVMIARKERFTVDERWVSDCGGSRLKVMLVPSF